MTNDLGPYSSGREFILSVDAALENSLQTKGFLRLRKLEFVYPLGDDFDGWLGLGRNNKHARFGQINLVANWGIHCRSISERRAVWTGNDTSTANNAPFH